MVFSASADNHPPPQQVSGGNSIRQMNPQTDSLPEASERGHLGTCVIDNNHMYLPSPTTTTTTTTRTHDLLCCHRCPC